MKMLFVVVAALLLIAPAAEAQIGVGAKLGLNIATVSADPELTGSKSKMGFVIGGVFEAKLGGPMYMAVEPLYAQKGVKQEGAIFQGPFGPVNGKSTSKVSEIDIPVLAKAKFLTGPVRPYVFAGPSVGFVLSAKDEWEPQGFASQEVDLKENTASVDFGLVFGGGAEFRVAPLVAITADLRYSLGLSDLAKETAGVQFDQKIRTRGFQVMAGALFML